MPPITAGNQPERSPGAVAQLQVFGTFVTSIAGTLGSNLLGALPLSWLLSATAFSAVAAGLSFSIGPSSVLAAVPDSWIFVAYILLGIVCGTPLAVVTALERSIDPIVQQFDRAAGPLVDGIAAEMQGEAPQSMVEFSARLDRAIVELRRQVGRMISPASPGGIVAWLVTRMILRDVRLSLAGEILAGVQAQASAGGSIDSIAPLVRSHITAAIGDDLKRRARTAWILSVVLWIAVLALSTLPIVFVR